MAFSLPVFLWVGLRASRGAPTLSMRDWLAIVVLGLMPVLADWVTIPAAADLLAAFVR